MKVVVLSSALLVAFLASPVFAQESSREDFREYCQTFQGRWVGDVTWVADWPGLGKRGEKATCYFESRVAEDGNALIWKFFGGNGSATGITVFDAGAKQIKTFFVVSGGHVGQDIICKKGKKWAIKSAGSNPDGTKTEGTATVTISDNGNTHTYTGSGTVGDEKQDDLHDVWRRVNK